MLGAVACGGRRPTTTCTRPAPDAGKLALPLPSVGDVVTVTLSVRPACKPDQPVNVQVEVLDPDNLPVTHTNTPPSAARPETAINFVAAKAGPYHLIARFEPELGQAQADLLIAELRNEPAAITATIPSSCSTVEPIGSDHLICFDTTTVRLVGPSGGVLQTLPAVGLSRAGDVAWLRTDVGVFRYVFDGGVLEQSPARNLAAFSKSGESSLAVTADNAFVVELAKAISADVSADAGAQSTFKSVTGPVVAVRSDGGVRAAVAFASWCQYGAAFTTDGGTCFPGEGTPVGQEDGHVWLHDKTSGALVAGFPGASVTAAPRTIRLRLPSPLTVVSLQPLSYDAVLPGVVPVIGDPANKQFSWIPKIANGAIVLEHHPLAGARVVNASTRYVRASAPDSGVELFAR